MVREQLAHFCVLVIQQIVEAAVYFSTNVTDTLPPSWRVKRICDVVENPLDLSQSSSPTGNEFHEETEMRLDDATTDLTPAKNESSDVLIENEYEDLDVGSDEWKECEDEQDASSSILPTKVVEEEPSPLHMCVVSSLDFFPLLFPFFLETNPLVSRRVGEPSYLYLVSILHFLTLLNF